jgi:hypothetical protein
MQRQALRLGEAVLGAKSIKGSGGVRSLRHLDVQGFTLNSTSLLEACALTFLFNRRDQE